MLYDVYYYSQLLSGFVQYSELALYMRTPGTSGINEILAILQPPPPELKGEGPKGILVPNM